MIGDHHGRSAGRATLLVRTVDAILGPEGDLVTDLQRAGLGRVAGRAHRSYQPGGGAWLVARLGIERMRDQIRHEGASQGDLNAALAALDDQTRTAIGGPIVTAWGQRPG